MNYLKRIENVEDCTRQQIFERLTTIGTMMKIHTEVDFFSNIQGGILDDEEIDARIALLDKYAQEAKMLLDSIRVK